MARSETTQGWLRTIVQLGAIVGGGALAFSHLEAVAAKALDRADEAKVSAGAVAKTAQETKDLLTEKLTAVSLDVREVKTILNERLPAKPAMGD